VGITHANTANYTKKAFIVRKRSHDALLRRLQKVPVSDVCVSVVTKSELLYGVEVSPRRQNDEAALKAFLNYVEVLDFPDNACPHYAQISRAVEEIGKDDWSQPSVHRRPRSQPGPDARHSQH
jgi:predicted nucleic acid-binding protein